MIAADIVEHATSLDQELGWAIQAAEAAGEIIRGGVGHFHDIQQKGHGDLVSDIDRRADQAIIDILQKYSTIPILSEELNPEVEDASDLWIVDPLDGTSAFLMQVGDHYSSVLIARSRRGKTFSGVCYFPLTNECFYAQLGCGAWKDGKRLSKSNEPTSLARSWVEMNQYGDSAFETEEFAELRMGLRSIQGACLVTTTVPYSGVAMRIAEANSGLVAVIHDNCAQNVKQAPWDIAAVKLILEEAGGVFLNLKGETVDPFCPEVMVVARSREIADDILAMYSNRVLAG